MTDKHAEQIVAAISKLTATLWWVMMAILFAGMENMCAHTLH